MLRFGCIIARCLFGIGFQCGSSLSGSEAMITAFSLVASFICISYCVSFDSLYSSSPSLGLFR